MARIIQHVLTLPFGTASVERDFSIVNIIKSKLRNRLSVPTLDALIRVREYIPDVFAKFIPTQAMYDLFNSDMYKTQAQDLRENINTAEEIDFFGEFELIPD